MAGGNVKYLPLAMWVAISSLKNSTSLALSLIYVFLQSIEEIALDYCIQLSITVVVMQ